tara:strand:- start:93 stop:326 length:234 start_codon:yes stop_codon:yes gene_type:complete
MKKVLSIIALSLLLSINASAGIINDWVEKGYKVKNEDLIEDRKLKIYTLINEEGFIVICTVQIKINGSIRKAKCYEQ